MNPNLYLNEVIFIFRVNLSLKEILENLDITEDDFKSIMIYLISDPDENSVNWSVANNFYNKDLSILKYVYNEIVNHIGSLLTNSFFSKNNLTGQYNLKSIDYIDTYSIAAKLTRSV